MTSYTKEFGSKKYSLNEIAIMLDCRKNIDREHYHLNEAAQAILYVDATGRISGTLSLALRNIKGVKAFSLIKNLSELLQSQANYNQLDAAMQILETI